jgi:hypothetical protein
MPAGIKMHKQALECREVPREIDIPGKEVHWNAGGIE